MKPFYDDGKGIVIYHGNCLDVLSQLEAVDHVITDPPYAAETHEGARTDGPLGEGTSVLIDFAPLTEEDVQEWLTLAEPIVGRWVVSFMDWRHVALLERCCPSGLRFVRFGIWYKPNGAPQFTGDRPATGWEAIAFLHKEGRMKWNGGGRHGVFIEPKVNSEHPTGKPIRLVKQFVELFTDLGDTILDPFMGSGTTLVAAKGLGRKAIGIELDENYCRIAVERLEATTPPLALEYVQDIGTQEVLL
jgi:site-specific DNA-methyltransferase (adenine-specific)